VWRAGSVRFIDWTTAVADAEPATVSLALSLAGPAGPWIDVATGMLNNGRHQWVVPADLPGSTTCHVRYRLTGAADPALSAGFTIVGAVPLGDADEDGSVDIADLATVADCLTGPDAGPATCPAVDADRDDDTDLHDLFAWQRQYGS
jgi:hypothetical protein